YTTLFRSAGAATRSGMPAAFSNRGSQLVWTIGVDVPVKKATGKINLQSGTSIASALAAGIAARLVDEKPGIKPEEAPNVLRATSKTNVTNGVAMLNLDSAVARLRAGG